MATKFESKDVDVEDWIDQGVSYLQAEVTIYRNPALYSKYAPLLESIKILEAERAKILGPQKKRKGAAEDSLGDEDLEPTVPRGEESLGESNALLQEIETELQKKRQEAERLWEEYSQNTEVWTLRRLDEAEVEEERQAMIEEGFVMPEQPRPAGNKPSAQAKHAMVKKMEKFLADVSVFAQELNLRCLSRAVLSVVVQGEEKTVPGLEGFRKLKARPGGEKHIHELVQALESLSLEDVAIMAPHREGAGA